MDCSCLWFSCGRQSFDIYGFEANRGNVFSKKKIGTIEKTESSLGGYEEYWVAGFQDTGARLERGGFGFGGPTNNDTTPSPRGPLDKREYPGDPTNNDTTPSPSRALGKEGVPWLFFHHAFS